MIVDHNTHDRRQWIARGCYPETEPSASSGIATAILVAVAVSLPSIFLAFYYGAPQCPMFP